ncbi:MAG TPA: hypothetical protein VNS33_13910 [Bradyrhizobium sp.]|nr:hypothetical protein [Bradyrhizobium sp.]
MFGISGWLEGISDRAALAALLMPLMVAGIAPLSPAGAHVHHSADGSAISWYPRDCCHDGDCHPVLRVQSASGGLLMTTEDGVTLFVNAATSRRPSRDSRWHVCFGAGEDPSVFCVFEPPNS